VKLTTGAKNYWPRWSPNGTRIAYIHELANGQRDIWVMNANGSNKQQVTNLGNVQAPAWSPDGTALAFGGGTPGQGTSLMRVNSTAPFGAPTLLLGWTNNPAILEPVTVQGAAAWAPDGQNIFFYSSVFPDSPDHYILQYVLATSQLDEWIVSGGACCGPGKVSQPVVSANGTRFGYTYDVDSPKIFLSGFPTFGGITFATQAQDEQLAFSPNGSKVAFMNDANGTPRIFTANANGSGRKVLTAGYQPDWQAKP
jgi:Tol biopolymer transport system component